MAFGDKNLIPVISGDEIEDAGKYGLLGAAGVYGAVHGTRYSGLPQLIAPLASRTSTIIEGFYDKGANKRGLFMHHVRKNWKDEMDKFIKRFPGHFPKDMPIDKKYNLVKKFMSQEGLKTPAELVHASEAYKIEQRWNAGLIDEPYGRGAALRKLRHEKLKTEMVNYTMGRKYNKRVLRESGLSSPVQTDIKNIFKGRESVGAQWGLHGDVKASVSHIRNIGADKAMVIKSATKDHMFKMAESVVNSGVDLRNRAAVEKIAADRLGMMGTELRGVNKLHPQVESIRNELRRFMQSYKVGPNGELLINFSPGYKPHYLSGGVNADVKVWKSRYGKLHRDILISDRYDVLGKGTGALQKRVHFNIAHSTTAGKSMKAEDFARIGRRKRLVKSLSLKEYGKAGKHSKELLKKLAFKIGRKALLRM